MSKFRSARAALVGGAVVVLAGCGTSAGSSGAAAGSTSSTAAAASSPSATSSAAANSFVASGSLPFPIAVGNTWVYKTTSAIDSQDSTTTNKIVSVVPISGGHQVTMAETLGAAGTATSTRPVFNFYSNGTIGYPLTQADGMTVVSKSGVLWPDAAGLASGRAYHSVLRIRFSEGGSTRYLDEDVTVQGGGTASVTVPAGTYQATAVDMTMGVTMSGYHSTMEVKTYLAQGTGPVKTEVFVHAGSVNEVAATQELVSFTKG